MLKTFHVLVVEMKNKEEAWLAVKELRPRNANFELVYLRLGECCQTLATVRYELLLSVSN
jgi:hypothetical protein